MPAKSDDVRRKGEAVIGAKPANEARGANGNSRRMQLGLKPRKIRLAVMVDGVSTLQGGGGGC